MNDRETTKASFRSYTTGFILSLILTGAAFYAVKYETFVGWGLVSVIMVLAVAQLLVQLIFFLHLARESNPRWNLVMFLFAGMVIAIVLLGSLWIMQNLKYNTMTPNETDKYLIKEERLKD